MMTKAQIDSITAKLSNITKKQGITYQSVATSFLIERLLARIIDEKSIAKNLVFKGGYVGLRVYNSERYTIDLDALLVKADIDKTLEKIKEASKKDLQDGTWFEFESQIDLKTQGEYGGVRHVYRGGIGAKPKDIKRAQAIHFDLGIGDPVTPSPMTVQTHELIGSEELSWQVYPIETIVAEKLQTLIVRGGDNSRAKDVYDLAFYISKADPKILSVALKNCFEYRGTELPKDIPHALESIDKTLLKRGWPAATASLKNPMSFEEAFEIIRNSFKINSL